MRLTKHNNNIFLRMLIFNIFYFFHLKKKKLCEMMWWYMDLNVCVFACIIIGCCLPSSQSIFKLYQQQHLQNPIFNMSDTYLYDYKFKNISTYMWIGIIKKIRAISISINFMVKKTRRKKNGYINKWILFCIFFYFYRTYGN